MFEEYLNEKRRTGFYDSVTSHEPIVNTSSSYPRTFVDRILLTRSRKKSFSSLGPDFSQARRLLVNSAFAFLEYVPCGLPATPIAFSKSRIFLNVFNAFNYSKMNSILPLQRKKIFHKIVPFESHETSSEPKLREKHANRCVNILFTVMADYGVSG